MFTTRLRNVAALGAALLATTLLAGCSTDSHVDTMPMPSSSIGASAEDAMFAQMMIPHHEQAVEMADLAETRASSPLIRELATDIRGAQQPEIDEMSSWLAEWGMPVQSADEAADSHGGHGMSGMLTAEQLDELSASNGATFDRLFAEYMIEHHEGAVEMARAVTVSDDPRAVKLANAIIEAQLAEIAVMEEFLANASSSS